MKKMLKFLLPSLAISPLLVSCSVPSIKLEHNELEQKWDTFLQREYIANILDLVFKDNQKAKQEYIKSQKEISNEYIKRVNSALLFAANPIKSITTPSTLFGRKPFILTKSSREIKKFTRGSYSQDEEKYTGNWLWFLFNLDKVKFSGYPEYDKFLSPSDATTADHLANTRNLGSFYKMKSNEMVQYVISEDEYSKIVYLLTKEGFIMEIRLTQDEDNLPLDVSIHTYIWTYKEIFNNKNLNEIFDIKAYSAIINNFEDKPIDRTLKVVYEEQYGGEPLRFTIFTLEE